MKEKFNYKTVIFEVSLGDENFAPPRTHHMTTKRIDSDDKEHFSGGGIFTLDEVQRKIMETIKFLKKEEPIPNEIQVNGVRYVRK